METASILDLFRRAVREQQLKISLHAAEEALAENITQPEIEAAILNAQLLEDYPDRWLGPSGLIYGQADAGRNLHIVTSYPGFSVTIITVHEPHPPQWATPTQRGGNKL